MRLAQEGGVWRAPDILFASYVYAQMLALDRCLLSCSEYVHNREFKKRMLHFVPSESKVPSPTPCQERQVLDGRPLIPNLGTSIPRLLDGFALNNGCWSCCRVDMG